MTTIAARPGSTGALRTRQKGNAVVRWITTTDHKLIGQLYLVTSFAFFLIGVLLAAAVLQFTRVRAVADARGVWVRNYVGEKFVPWQVVAGVRLDDGSPWASLDLQDDDTIALLAVQANDGARAVDAVLALRALLATARNHPD